MYKYIFLKFSVPVIGKLFALLYLSNNLDQDQAPKRLTCLRHKHFETLKVFFLLFYPFLLREKIGTTKTNITQHAKS